jgi:membrane protein implicated in regulation of membrane protease activity
MNLSLSKLPWYGQLGAFAVLSIAAAGVFWNFYAKPRKPASMRARHSFARSASTSPVVARRREGCLNSDGRSTI